MSSLRVTYDGDQHVTAVREPQHNTVALDCPYTGKGDEFSPSALLGISLASCMLLSMGAIARRDHLDLSGTVVDVELTGLDKRIPHVDTISLTFNIPFAVDEQERRKLERAACICPVMESFCEDTRITTNYRYARAETELS